MPQTFSRVARLPFPAEDVFDWHARPGAFERLNPPWSPAELVAQSGGIENGARVELRAPVGPFKMTWIAEHRDYIAGRQFVDVQTRGPFAKWEHTHRISPVSENSCELRDEIQYRLPGGAAGNLLGGRSVKRMLERMFAYRHRVTFADLKQHAIYSKGRAMKVLVSGGTGLIGSKLRTLLTTGGHEAVSLTRSEKPGAVQWNPSEGRLDASRLEGFDAVVHLAGENIGDKRWSAEQKAKIRDSRVQGTKLLAESLAGLERPPRVLVCASAVGYYGDRGDETLDETSSAGDGFLPDVCREWEAAADAAREKGIRVVHARFGVVLSPEGGALQKMLFPFKMGVGGVIGDGKQYWSWVAVDDVTGSILHALATENLRGPVNVVSPNPATNREFTKTLGKVLGRPTIFPMPAFAARLAFGEMADDLLLASSRVLPKQLQATGYEFRNPDLEPALRHLLGK